MTDETEQECLVREADLGRVRIVIFKSADRWTSVKDTRRATFAWFEAIFIDTSVNFDVFHRLIRRRLGVDSSFTSGVCVRTTTTCTPSATIRMSRRTVAVERTRKRRTVLFVSNKVTSDDRTVVLSMTFICK